MYKSYFRFSALPFENNLNPRFLYLSEDHNEVLAALHYFIKTNESFAIVCGDVGTGKTMLVNAFLKRLVPKSVQTIIISNPYLDSHGLLRYVAQVMNIAIDENQPILDLIDKVKSALIDANSPHHQLLLIVDEAHLLSDETLEEIRLLSNIETDDKKLLQVLLVGQYELSQKLSRPEMRQLRQRLNINRFLSPLTAVETIKYIDHRLKKVGSSFESCFTANCRSLIYKMTGGVPRQINRICDSALLICMTEGRRKVNRKILQKAQEALGTDQIFTPQHLPRKQGLLKPLIPISVGLGALLGVLLGIILIYFGFGINPISSLTLSVTSGFQRSTPVKHPKSSPSPPMYFVNVRRLALRDGPTVSAPKIATLNFKDKVELLDTSRGWGRIRHVNRNIVGWSYMRYLQPLPPAGPPLVTQHGIPGPKEP
jgi:general secretion pathway protein A